MGIKSTEATIHMRSILYTKVSEYSTKPLVHMRSIHMRLIRTKVSECLTTMQATSTHEVNAHEVN